MVQNTKPTLEEIVDDYVQRARSKLRPTEYERSEKDEVTLHHVIENDEFRILDHIIAVKDRRVEWIWRSQDFWPTDQLTDITMSDVDLRNYGVIHGSNRISGVKFTIGPRHYAGPDPDACLPYVNDFLYLEAHYRWDDDKMTAATSTHRRRFQDQRRLDPTRPVGRDRAGTLLELGLSIPVVAWLSPTCQGRRRREFKDRCAYRIDSR